MKLTCTRLEDDLVRHRVTAESLRITSGQLCAVAWEKFQEILSTGCQYLEKNSPPLCVP